MKSQPKRGTYGARVMTFECPASANDMNLFLYHALYFSVLALEKSEREYTPRIFGWSGDFMEFAFAYEFLKENQVAFENNMQSKILLIRAKILSIPLIHCRHCCSLVFLNQTTNKKIRKFRCR